MLYVESLAQNTYQVTKKSETCFKSIFSHIWKLAKSIAKIGKI